jgi:signal transduction histidine kinase
VGGKRFLGAFRGRVIAPKGIPMWVYCGAGVFASLVVGVALASGGSSLPVPAQLVLAVIVLIPWIPGIRQRWLSWGFVLMSTLPTIALTWTGGSPLLFGLLALSASRVAVSGPWPKSAFYGIAAIAIVIGRHAVGNPTNWMVWKTYVELGLALGWAMRSQRMLVARTREASIEHARLAALEERRRIARDVHDVLAHTLTILMIHVNSARLLAPDDPEATAEVLDEVAAYGRICLDEIRRTVGLLSEPSAPELAVGPLEAAQAIEALVAVYRKAGAHVELHYDVEFAHSGPVMTALDAVWGSSYRIVQESLANAAKHAPTSAIDVCIGLDESGWHVRCVNDLRPGVVMLELPRGGNGIVGMRERATALGGTFIAGIEGNAWVVRADFPLTNAATPERRQPATLGRAS